MFNKFKKSAGKPKSFSKGKPGGGFSKPFGKRSDGDRPAGGGDRRRPFSSGRDDSFGGPREFKPRDGGSRRPDGESGGAGGFKRSGGFKPGGPRGGFGEDRPKRPFGKPGFKPGGAGERPRFGGDRPERPRFGGDRPERPFGKPAFRAGSGDERPRFGGDRPRFGDRPERPRFGGDRPERPRFGGDRPERPRFGKPDLKRGGGSDRPRWSDDKPARPFGKPDYNAGGFRKPFNDRNDRSSDERGEVGFREDRGRESRDFQSAQRNDRPFKPNFEKDKSFRKTEFLHSRGGAEGRGPGFDSSNAPADGIDVPSAPWARQLTMSLADTKTVPIRVVWLFDTMVGELPDGEPAAGDTVYVHDAQNRFLGSAIYNPHSKIRARIFSLTKQLFSESYIRRALTKAVELRSKMGFLTGSCRVVFGESDGIPGLIVDKIGDYLVIQPLTYAVDKYVRIIVDTLNELVCPQGIVVRKDAAVRLKEGLENGDAVTHGEIPDVVGIREHDYKLFANITSGQKTGMFLDQKLNRLSIIPFSRGAKVLDLFCHVGGWAICAASNGASKVIGVDTSKPAIELAEKAVAANSLDNVEFVESDVFDFLRDHGATEDDLYDVIVCDPPAFAKTRAHFEDAMRAYLSLNYMAMKRLKPGGVLISCSCSQAVDPSDYEDMLLTAARNARIQFQILERRGAPPDHPVLLGLPETDYLKCFVLRRTE